MLVQLECEVSWAWLDHEKTTIEEGFGYCQGSNLKMNQLYTYLWSRLGPNPPCHEEVINVHQSWLGATDPHKARNQLTNEQVARLWSDPVAFVLKKEAVEEPSQAPICAWTNIFMSPINLAQKCIRLHLDSGRLKPHVQAF